jgi:hypothetical protein
MAIESKKFKVELTFTELLLGTVPKDKEVYQTYIESKAPPATETGDELESLEDLEEKGWTGFHTMDDGRPMIYNYAIKGYFKDACGMLRRVSGSRSSKLKAYKKVIDGLVFVDPRMIPIDLPEGEEITILERTIRVETPKGPRVALTRSDACPVGSTMTFYLRVLAGVSEALLKEWFDYGYDRGLGQWRNGGYGSFEYNINTVETLKT